MKNVNLASHSFICIAEKLVCTETFDYLTVANLAQLYVYVIPDFNLFFFFDVGPNSILRNISHHKTLKGK